MLTHTSIGTLVSLVETRLATMEIVDREDKAPAEVPAGLLGRSAEDATSRGDLLNLPDLHSSLTGVRYSVMAGAVQGRAAKGRICGP
jgi:hypothetical protein